MNTYRLDYYDHTGKYKTERVEWKCDGPRYILDRTNCFGVGDYIVATKI